MGNAFENAVTYDLSLGGRIAVLTWDPDFQRGRQVERVHEGVDQRVDECAPPRPFQPRVRKPRPAHLQEEV